MKSGKITQAEYDAQRANLLGTNKTGNAISEGSDDSKSEIIRIATEAGALIQSAAIAGDIINGHNLVPDVETAADDSTSSFWDTFKGGAAQIGNVLAGGLSQTEKIRAEARARYAFATHPESFTAYTNLKALSEQMVFPILSTGALGVNPTDADVDLARKSQFDVSAPSVTWASQLNRLIATAGGDTVIPNVKLQSVESESEGENSGGQQEANAGMNGNGSEATPDSVFNKGWSFVPGG